MVMTPYFLVKLNAPKLVSDTQIDSYFAHDPAPQHDLLFGNFTQLSCLGSYAALHDVEHTSLIDFINYLEGQII